MLLLLQLLSPTRCNFHLVLPSPSACSHPLMTSLTLLPRPLLVFLLLLLFLPHSSLTYSPSTAALTAALDVGFSATAVVSHTLTQYCCTHCCCLSLTHPILLHLVLASLKLLLSLTLCLFSHYYRIRCCL